MNLVMPGGWPLTRRQEGSGDFEALVLEGEELQSSQDVYRSKLRETTLCSKDILRRGRSFRNRLVAGTQSVFGVESPVLLEVGAKPRLPRSPRRRTLEKRIADVKEQLAVLEAAAEAEKAKNKG